ncbi:MAG: efflux RND transporter periplasmic adaptor subunit [bacterium]
MIRKWILTIGCLIVVLTVSCTSSDIGQEKTAVPVEVMTVKKGDIKQTLEFNGDIVAEYTVKVFSKIPDRITKFYLDEGNKVLKGDIIAEVEATQQKQAVRRAKAGLTAAKSQLANISAEFERAKRLYSENAMSKQQYDAVKTQYEAVQSQVDQAEAGLASAQSSLKDASITAPISGIIGKRHYEEGDMASPQLPVVTIVQMDNVKMVFEATDKEFGKLKLEQPAQVKVTSYPNERFLGKIIKISPILDPITRLADIEILIPNPDSKLKPGMFARTEVTIGLLEDKIIIPRYSAIETTTLKSVQGQDRVVKEYHVYTVNDSSKAVQRDLEVEYVNHKNIVVNSGIEVGEKIVVSGQNKLLEGTVLNIITEKEEAAL